MERVKMEKSINSLKNYYNWTRVILLGLVIFTGINTIYRLDARSEELIGGVIDRDVVARNVEHLLKTKECRNCDLRGAWLVGLNLKGADLRGAKLGLANLDYANLENADLRESKMGEYTTRKSPNNPTNIGQPLIISLLPRHVSLKNTNLRSANLSGLTLTDYLQITGANMSNANLENVKISPYIDFTGVSLQGANLKGLTIEPPFELIINLDLCGAVLTKPELYSYFMRGCKN